MQGIELKKIIEAIIFISEKPVKFKQLADLCQGVEAAEIRSVLKALMEDYSAQEHGIQIVEIAGGYQFCTNPDCADHIRKLYKTRRIWRLSGPSLETMAIIAYKQLVTRSEMEFIRGVNVDGVIKTLTDRGLIKEKGRKDVPGKPILYGTTDDFLQYFGLKSLQDLPSLEEFAAKALEEGIVDEPNDQEIKVEQAESDSNEIEQSNQKKDDSQDEQEIIESQSPTGEHSEITQDN